jgi:hypothetical protein
MEKKSMNSRIYLVLSVIAAGVLFRFIPHWPNFTPIAAIALFGGTYLGKKYLSFLVPLAAMFISDIFLGLHAGMWAVYMAFALTVLMGFYIRKNLTASNVAVASIISSLMFYIITNFAAWLASPVYPQNFAGLMESYIAGLAFFNNGSYGISFFLNEVIGGLFYNGIFFGIYYAAVKLVPAKVGVIK